VSGLGEGAAPGLLFILSGPSGVGKDAVMAKLWEEHFPLHFGVTATTRSSRQGEVEGVDYYFVSEDEFQRMIDAGEMLEWAEVHCRRYGVPRASVRRFLQMGEDVLMRVDVQGAATIRSKVPEAVLIFLAPPSMDSLIARLRGRGTETQEQLATRIANAYEEMTRLSEFDYRVENPDGDLADAVDRVKSIVKAEKCRVDPRRAVV